MDWILRWRYEGREGKGRGGLVKCIQHHKDAKAPMSYMDMPLHPTPPPHPQLQSALLLQMPLPRPQSGWWRPEEMTYFPVTPDLQCVIPSLPGGWGVWIEGVEVGCGLASVSCWIGQKCGHGATGSFSGSSEPRPWRAADAIFILFYFSFLTGSNAAYVLL